MGDWECMSRLSDNHPRCGYRMTDEQVELAKFTTCPRCGESMVQHMMPIHTAQESDDE